MDNHKYWIEKDTTGMILYFPSCIEHFQMQYSVSEAE